MSWFEENLLVPVAGALMAISSAAVGMIWKNLDRRMGKYESQITSLHEKINGHREGHHSELRHLTENMVTTADVAQVQRQLAVVNQNILEVLKKQ